MSRDLSRVEKIYLRAEYTDMRKQLDGLGKIILSDMPGSTFPENPEYLDDYLPWDSMIQGRCRWPLPFLCRELVVIFLSAILFDVYFPFTNKIFNASSYASSKYPPLLTLPANAFTCSFILSYSVVSIFDNLSSISSRLSIKIPI